MYAYMHAYLKLVCKDKKIKKTKDIATSWELKFEEHNFQIEELQIKG
jgi:hypothetical protein